MSNEYLQELYALQLLDAASDEAFQNIVRTAALVCGTADSAITFIDKHRQWSKASTAEGNKNLPLEHSFCMHTLHAKEGVFIVENTEKDSRFVNNPLVTAHNGMRFYAGVQIKSPGGAAVGSLCVFHHKFHQLNDEQVNALKLLAKQVDLLIQQKAQQVKLEKAKREAESKERINKIMLSMVAHEIRAPLNNINMVLSLFKEGVLNREELSQLLDDSQERMDLLICSVEKLLSIGKKALYAENRRPDFCDIKEVIEEVVHEQRPAIEAKGNTVTITNTIHEQVYADADGLQLMVGNLLHNANKYTSNGNISIWILQEEESLVVKVMDDGKGMDKQTLRAVMQAEPVTSTAGTHQEIGTGIGLLLTHEYLALTGGEMFVSSAINKGSTFILKLKEVQFVKQIPVIPANIDSNVVLSGLN